MKALLLFLLSLPACADEQLTLPSPKCEHTVYWNEDRQKLEIEINSALPSVEICWSTQNQIENCFTVQANYFECVSMSLPDDETLITIYAEQTCEYAF